MKHWHLLLPLILAAAMLPGAAAPASAGSPTMIVRAYFVLEGPAAAQSGLVPVLRTVPRTTAVATAAVRQLLAGPSQVERSARPRVTTTIPSGARLLGVRIAGGTATVNLSRAFASGGGSLSMFMRLGQLTYTLTQFPTVSRVRLQLDGVPVTTFSSEGIVLSAPLTRATFRTDILPSIFVDRPAYRAAFLSGGHVTGVANVFEAVFRVELLDSRRHVLVNRQVMATCGTGCWGRFDVTLHYTVRSGQWGWLRVWDLSAKDGSAVDIREYPIWLTATAQ
jgi:germination protein M